ncbi:hypothetical protein QIS74_11667 [Colletotrichum tabaci]|uniref:NAD-dependent epimerase/dehydratase domain-containing protein n=1 Tax=Colletotrichum tabaci TaxID=1209068 RepID=A0AAV9SZ81_9PEZI
MASSDTETAAVILPGSTILVTGANGYLGCRLSNTLTERGYRVRGVYGTEGQFDLFEVPDLTKQGAFDDAVKGCAGFVHLAVDNGFSPDPTVVVDGSVALTIRALEAAASEPGLRRFVLTSSYITACQCHMNEAYDVTQASWNDDYIVFCPDGADGLREEAQDGQRGAEEAWKALRFEHPMIAVELGHDRQSLLYASTVNRESFLEEWPSETFIVDAGEQRPAGAVFPELRPPCLMELRFLPNTG